MKTCLVALCLALGTLPALAQTSPNGGIGSLTPPPSQAPPDQGRPAGQPAPTPDDRNRPVQAPGTGSQQ